jgi:two-component system response regulator AlgR
MSATPQAALRALIVDDEPLARQRLAVLLSRLDEPVQVVGEAGDAGTALAWLEARPGQVDLVLLDIQMPGPDGLRLADKIRVLSFAPQVVFVTAHAEHALKAFELEASDYLTKPVRQERLAQAIARCRKRMPAPSVVRPTADSTQTLLVQERGRLVKVPVSEILYLKAELKYVTLRTAAHSYVLDASLTDLEARLGAGVIRVPRTALVARAAVRRLERRDDPDGGEGWAVQVSDTGEWLTVSRRQVPAVKDALTEAGKG